MNYELQVDNSASSMHAENRGCRINCTATRGNNTVASITPAATYCHVRGMHNNPGSYRLHDVLVGCRFCGWLLAEIVVEPCLPWAAPFCMMHYQCCNAQNGRIACASAAQNWHPRRKTKGWRHIHSAQVVRHNSTKPCQADRLNLPPVTPVQNKPSDCAQASLTSNGRVWSLGLPGTSIRYCCSAGNSSHYTWLHI